MRDLVTELARSRAPHLLQTLRRSCVAQLKERFAQLPRERLSDELAIVVRLLLDLCPDTPQFELVVCNLVEDLCFQTNMRSFMRQDALNVASSHSSPLASSVCMSLSTPLFETLAT